MTEWRCPDGHEVSSDTGKVPSNCPACGLDLQRITNVDDYPPEVIAFAEEHGLDPQKVAKRRAES